jgi:hypothetical protein
MNNPKPGNHTAKKEQQPMTNFHRARAALAVGNEQ